MLQLHFHESSREGEAWDQPGRFCKVGESLRAAGSLCERAVALSTHPATLRKPARTPPIGAQEGTIPCLWCVSILSSRSLGSLYADFWYVLRARVSIQCSDP